MYLSNMANLLRSNGNTGNKFGRLLTAIDIGTSKVCVLIGDLGLDGRIEVVGYGQVPCAGLRRGAVVNIDATAEALRAAAAEAENTAGAAIGPAVVSISGVHIHGLNSHGVVGVHGGEVGLSDIGRVIQAARAVAIPLDRQILHVLPHQFAVDEQAGVRDPIGMSGIRLEASIHIVTAALSYCHNLSKCCQRAGISVLDRMFAPLASANAALFPEERELGVVVIDIGEGSTGMVVFHSGAVMHTAVLPVGGAHVTNDLAEGLCVPTSEAERLKINYGVVTISAQRGEFVQISGIGGREPRRIERRLMADIIEPRIEEMFAFAQDELIRSGIYESLASGVVLVGGTALLEGAQEVAERIFDLPVRRGLPTNITSMPEELMKPTYTAAAGLLIDAAEWDRERKGIGRLGRLGWLRSRLSDWARELFL